MSQTVQLPAATTVSSLYATHVMQSQSDNDVSCFHWVSGWLRSGERAGQSVSMPSCWIYSSTTLPWWWTRSDCTNAWSEIDVQDLIPVAYTGHHASHHNVRVCSAISVDASRQYDGASTLAVMFRDIGILKSHPTVSPHLSTLSCTVKTVPWIIDEEYMIPVVNSPFEVILGTTHFVESFTKGWRLACTTRNRSLLAWLLVVDHQHGVGQLNWKRFNALAITLWLTPNTLITLRCEYPRSNIPKAPAQFCGGQPTTLTLRCILVIKCRKKCFRNWC